MLMKGSGIMATKMFQKRIDQDLYDTTSKIYNELGTSVEAAFVMFLKKTIEKNGLPFELKIERIPNSETIAAMNEDLSNAKSYSSFNELLNDIDED
ncbi:DNA-damage-inducible protein J [Bacilli bacterium PM5-3]|nr:DNA-damage-inducible protein J [Bacilli bacterium PM5-3]MDH6603873.1 DNA-damage-inducible protein J [Bacilli bacterium PM5-9]